MSLFTEWKELIDNQTKASIDAFFFFFCDTEVKLYSYILDHPDEHFKGNVGELIEEFKVEPVLFVGFLDGITSSLNNELTDDDLEAIDESSDIDLDIDLEKLYLNMLNADAPHLSGLEQWETLLTEEKRKELLKEHRRAGTVVKGEKIGRNDPCPCGSGKKYKHCCGRN